MRMKMKVLSPGVKDGQKPNGSAQTPGVGRNREQRFRSSTEENAIDLACVLKRQQANPLGQCKHNVEIRDRQQFGLPLRQPFGAGRGLTLWTMSVAARVIRDDTVAARIALLHKLHVAAKGSRAAVANRRESLPLMGTEHMSPFSEELFLVRAEGIGHFQPMLFHRFGGMVAVDRTRSSDPSISSGLLVERTVVSETCRYRAVVFRCA